MGAETSYHKIGKEWAKLYLMKRGFKEDEIFEEYHFPLETNWRRIDIVGIKPDLKIAFEIGNVGGGYASIVSGYENGLDAIYPSDYFFCEITHYH